MCGIVGVIQSPGQAVDPGVLARMGDAIRHRGPDDQGTLLEGAVGLHHRRLSVIDLATGHQPMSTEGTTLVYNGEIYNYRELRSELEARGHRFATRSDTEVLLRGYLAWGPDVVARLNGMFAFLLLDRPRQRIVGARDPFGIKPLYLHQAPGRLVFASEIKAILAHPGIEARLDREALDDYVTFQFVLGDRTLFRDVRKVLPGHVVTVDLADLSVATARFWEPTFPVENGRDEGVLAEELAALLDDAVRLQMRSDVPVGTYLSGGMDSSTTTVLAARHAGSGLRTYTGAFPHGPAFDERPYARAVVEASGAVGVEIEPTAEEFVTLLPGLVKSMDEPAAGPGLFPQFIVSRRARQDVTVVLGGQGGDEIFGGYARYLAVLLAEQEARAARGETGGPDPDLAFLEGLRGQLRGYEPMLAAAEGAGPAADGEARYFRLVDRSGGLEGFSGDFRARFDRGSRFERFAQVFRHPATDSLLDRMLYFDQVASLPGLLQVEDRVSMAVSLESRVPLMDVRVADWAARVPPRLKFREGAMKHLLRRAAWSRLPAIVRERTDKVGFAVPLQAWARGPIRDFLGDVLLSATCRARGLFDPGQVGALLEGEAAFGRRVWGLLNLELWFRAYGVS